MVFNSVRIICVAMFNSSLSAADAPASRTLLPIDLSLLRDSLLSGIPLRRRQSPCYREHIGNPLRRFMTGIPASVY